MISATGFFRVGLMICLTFSTSALAQNERKTPNPEKQAPSQNIGPGGKVLPSVTKEECEGLGGKVVPGLGIFCDSCSTVDKDGVVRSKCLERAR